MVRLKTNAIAGNTSNEMYGEVLVRGAVYKYFPRKLPSTETAYGTLE